MHKLQTQGLHHVTLVGADRQTSIDFWEGVLGMPFIFEQPNLDSAGESHIYFDPGDSRLITVFTREDRKPVRRRTPTDSGCVHHIAFNVSRAVFMQAVERLGARGIPNTGVRDRMIFDAIYFEDPLGLLIELSCWKFDAPEGFTPFRRAVCCASICALRAATARSWKFTSPTRSRVSSSRRPRACRPTARPRTLTSAATRQNSRQRNRRKPHVCNQASCHQAERQQHDRARVRARGEARLHRGRRLRQDPNARVYSQEPFIPDADGGSAGPAEGRAVGELRDHAVSLQQASSRQVLSDRAGKARDGRQRDVLYRRHALSLYRALDLWRAELPAISGRSRRQRRDASGEGEGAEGGGRGGRRDARRVPQVLSRRQDLRRRRPRRRSPTSASLAASNSSRSSTTIFPNGRRPTWARSPRRSATPMRSRRRTSRATSPM